MQSIFVQLSNAILPARNTNNWTKVCSSDPHKVQASGLSDKDKYVLINAIKLALEVEYGAVSENPYPRNAFVTLSDPANFQTKDFPFWVFNVGIAPQQQ